MCVPVCVGVRSRLHRGCTDAYFGFKKIVVRIDVRTTEITHIQDTADIYHAPNFGKRSTAWREADDSHNFEFADDSGYLWTSIRTRNKSSRHSCAKSLLPPDIGRWLSNIARVNGKNPALQVFEVVHVLYARKNQMEKKDEQQKKSVANNKEWHVISLWRFLARKYPVKQVAKFFRNSKAGRQHQGEKKQLIEVVGKSDYIFNVLEG